MLQSRIDELRHVFGSALVIRMMAYPQDYSYGLDKAGDVADKVITAVRTGAYTHDAPVMKDTCRALGIKNTRKAIAAFLNGK